MDTDKILDLTHFNAEYTRMLNEIAANSKKPYTEFVDKYSKKYGDFYLWWTTPFSSRNTNLDATFQNICYLLLCHKVICENNEIKHIVLDNKALYDTLCRNYEQELANKKIKLECRERTNRIFSEIVRFCLEFIQYFKNFIITKKYIGKVRYDTKECVSLIDTSAILSSSFQNGEYQDRYFKNIQCYTKHNIYFIPTALIVNSSIGLREFISKLKESKTHNFLFKEKFLHVFDFVYVVEYFLYCLLLYTKKYKYLDIDVTPLVRRSLLKGCHCIPSIKGVLNYQFIRRLKQSNMKIDNLISWYEGRPNDVMLHKAFRHYYPEINCVGYIGCPPLEFQLGQYVSDEQAVQKSAPLKMTIPGSMYEEQAKQFCQNVNVIKVPVLRNDYFCRSGTVIENSKKSILVILSYSEDSSGSMLHILNEYMKTNKNKFDIYIKNHPAHADKKIDYYTEEKIYFQPIYVDGELIECLQNADIAYMSYSTATLEVLSQGKYLINLCPVGKLRYTGLPEGFSNDLYHFAYGQQEVFEALDALSISEEKTINISELMEPINEESINRMWE